MIQSFIDADADPQFMNTPAYPSARLSSNHPRKAETSIYQILDLSLGLLDTQMMKERESI